MTEKIAIAESINSLLLWLGVVALGYAYVAVFLCDRWLPFRSGNNSCQDFLVLFCVCSLLFWSGPVHNFEFKARDASRALRLTSFLVPFISALHWAFLGDALSVHFSLTPDSLSSLDLVSLIALIAAAFGVVIVFVYHIVQAIRAGMLGWYLTAFSIPVAFIGLVTMVMTKTHFLHFHHYCVGLLLFPFCQFRSTISVACQGFFLGLAVEGVARWGLDPVWCLR